MRTGWCFSFMLFCIAAVQHKTWCIWSHHTCWFDRLTSKAGQIREGMVALRPLTPPGLCGTECLPVPVLLETEAMNVLNHALSVWAQHREFRAVFAELTRHTDRELNDMGIDRSDITRIAYQEAERRIVTPAASSTPAIAGYDPYLLAAG